MLRVVIQVSMFLAIPIMAGCLFILPQHAPWYISYVLVFNMLVGPVFSAGSVTSERERQTLDLLLTTTITPWQILWGKLVAGLRISSVLTCFLVWPVCLAGLMVNFYWKNLIPLIAYLVIVLLTCATTGVLALGCSVLFRKTSMSLMTTYLLIIVLFCAPLAAHFFAGTFFPRSAAADYALQSGIVSPFASAFAVPLNLDLHDVGPSAVDGGTEIGSFRNQGWRIFLGYVLTTVALNMGALVSMIWLFQRRWRVSQ